MFNALFAKINWRVVTIYFLNAISAIKSRSFVCLDAEWLILLLYGRIFLSWDVVLGVVKLLKACFVV